MLGDQVQQRIQVLVDRLFCTDTAGIISTSVEQSRGTNVFFNFFYFFEKKRSEEWLLSHKTACFCACVCSLRLHLESCLCCRWATAPVQPNYIAWTSPRVASLLFCVFLLFLECRSLCAIFWKTKMDKKIHVFPRWIINLNLVWKKEKKSQKHKNRDCFWKKPFLSEYDVTLLQLLWQRIQSVTQGVWTGAGNQTGKTESVQGSTFSRGCVVEVAAELC